MQAFLAVKTSCRKHSLGLLVRQTLIPTHAYLSSTRWLGCRYWNKVEWTVLGPPMGQQTWLIELDLPFYSQRWVNKRTSTCESRSSSLGRTGTEPSRTHPVDTSGIWPVSIEFYALPCACWEIMDEHCHLNAFCKWFRTAVTGFLIVTSIHGHLISLRPGWGMPHWGKSSLFGTCICQRKALPFQLALCRSVV